MFKKSETLQLQNVNKKLNNELKCKKTAEFLKTNFNKMYTNSSIYNAKL